MKSKNALLALLFFSPILLTACSTSTKDSWCDDDPSYANFPQCLNKTKQREYNLDLSLIIIGLLLLIVIIFFFLRWVAMIAKKNNRSVIGFVMLGFIFPFVAWVILLTMNKVEIKEPDRT